MLINLVPLTLLITAVLASGDAIAAAMGKIANSTMALNKTVGTFPSGVLAAVSDALPLLSDSATLLADINSGTQIAKASANLTIPEAFQIASATSSLATTVQQTLATVENAKKKFDSLVFISPVILLNLKMEKDATDKFSAAVVSKVPDALQGTAKSLIAPIDTAFDSAISFYT
ncbi:hypothetical protein BP5796_03446 [Coleophoma crateriformis]|uniref:Antigenic cell wall galactomannoprotein n=1 Tax=Coleophoma crateriformis TaxID=565419 RepID=A0A3D8SN84_9HELO|nr:hypothetical protein BP5796_03446 [Coleophoma crateriformis]